MDGQAEFGGDERPGCAGPVELVSGERVPVVERPFDQVGFRLSWAINAMRLWRGIAGAGITVTR
jgi:hypothetical protein